MANNTTNNIDINASVKVGDGPTQLKAMKQLLIDMRDTLKQMNGPGTSTGSFSKFAIEVSASLTALRQLDKQLSQMAKGDVLDRMNRASLELKKNITSTADAMQVLRLSGQKNLIFGSTPADVNQRIDAQALKVGQARLAYEKDQTKVNKDNLTTQLKVQAALEKQLTTIRQIDAIKKQTQSNNLKSTDADFLASQNKLNQARVFGDGGASLFKIQAALLVNYTVMNQLFNLFQFGTQYVVEFDKALTDLQAITVTTDENMKGLSQSIIAAAQGSRFTAVQVANAAKTLGQAGFSANQIKSALDGVVKLATATGSDLAESVDVATSAISVFNLRAEDMSHVADVVTGALNETKLDIVKLAQGIQYAGNVAVDAGLSFEETTAVLGAMSNAGIRSGSTLGTGLRNVLTELLNPSDKLRQKLEQVGLTIADVDIRSKGFSGVMKTLRDAGFSAGDAFESLDLRAAAAFSAIEKNPEVINRLTQSFLFSSAAAQANEKQMTSLSARSDQFSSSLGVVIAQMSGPLVEALKGTLFVATGFLNVLSQFPHVLQAIGTGLAAFAIVAAGEKLLTLTAGVLKLRVALTAVKVAFTEGAIAGGIFEGIMGGLAVIFSPLTVVVTAIIAAIAGITYELDKSSSAVESAQTAFDNAKGSYESTNSSLQEVNDSLGTLIDRYDELKKDPSALYTQMLTLESKFSSLGLTIKNRTTASVNELVDAMENLRNKMQQVSMDNMKMMLQQQALLFQAQAAKGLDASTGIVGFNFSGGVQTPSYLKSQGVGSISDAGKFYQANQGINLGNLSPQALNELQNSVTDVITKVNADLGKVRNAIIAAGGRDKADGQLLDEEKILSENLNNLNSTASTVASYIANQLEQLHNVLKTTGGFDAYEKELDAAKIHIEVLQDQISEALKSKNTVLASSLEGDLRTYSDVETAKLMDMLHANMDEILAALSKAAGRPVGAAEAEAIIRSEITADVNKFRSDAINKAGDAMKMITTRFTAQLKRAQTNFEKITQVYSHINDNLENAAKNMEQITTEATDLDRGGLAGKLSDVQIEQLKDAQKANQINQVHNRLGYINNLIGAQGAIVGAYGNINKEAQSAAASKLATPEQKAAAADAEKNYIDAQYKEIDLKNQQIQLQDQYNAMTGQTIIQQESLIDQIKYAGEQYRKEGEITSQWSYDVRANVRKTLDDSGAAFKGFITDIVTGTETVGSAFRKMMSAIIKSMLDTTTTKLGGQFASILGSVGGALLGGIFGGASPTVVGSASQLVGTPSGAAIVGNTAVDWNAGSNMVNFNSGGIIKAAQGAYIGRDNQMVMAQEGEGVLRRSAMDLLGQDNFNQLNAMGNRKMSQSMPKVSKGSDQTEGQTMNVYIISPDQKPSLTKNDVIVTISEDLRNGGPTKKLVKSIQQGQT